MPQVTTRTSKFRLDVVPQPAPRPRVSKWGTYMPTSYKVYQKEITALLPVIEAQFEGELAMKLEFVCKPIGKSKYTTPMGDVDNFAKGVMDTMTDCGWWDDDRQVMDLHVSKRFPLPGEQPHINVSLTTI